MAGPFGNRFPNAIPRVVERAHIDRVALLLKLVQDDGCRDRRVVMSFAISSAQELQDCRRPGPGSDTCGTHLAVGKKLHAQFFWIRALKKWRECVRSGRFERALMRYLAHHRKFEASHVRERMCSADWHLLTDQAHEVLVVEDRIDCSCSILALRCSGPGKDLQKCQTPCESCESCESRGWRVAGAARRGGGGGIL